MRRVVASISSELDLDSLFDRVVGSAVELLDADSGVISLIDDDGAARVRAVHNLAPEYADYLAKRPNEPVNVLLAAVDVPLMSASQYGSPHSPSTGRCLSKHGRSGWKTLPRNSPDSRK